MNRYVNTNNEYENKKDFTLIEVYSKYLEDIFHQFEEVEIDILKNDFFKDRITMNMIYKQEHLQVNVMNYLD